MLDQYWISGISFEKQAHYQPVTDCIYWTVLVSCNNWNIIHLTPKATPFEAFYDIHQIVLDGIRDNMASLAQSGKYSVINIADTTVNGFYVIKFVSESYTLQNNTKMTGNLFLLVN